MGLHYEAEWGIVNDRCPILDIIPSISKSYTPIRNLDSGSAILYK